MPPHSVDVTAASRLHFGLLAFGEGHERQFGGVGVMVRPPELEIRATRSDGFVVDGPGAERVIEFAARWTRFHGLHEPPACRIVVRALPPLHTGLGTGTQLGLAVATALSRLAGLGPPSPATTAQSVGRGLRSAVGTHGFFEGGLVYELGKAATDVLAPLERRIELPATWRFVLIRPRTSPGLSGDVEREAFAQVPPVPHSVVKSLTAEVRERLLPAAAAGHFAAFSESLYKYGLQAGLSFASVQGGAYHGPHLSELVEQIRARGIVGVGQSSWGPTLFALCPDANTAEQLKTDLAQMPAARHAELQSAAPWNHGAEVVES